MSIINFFMCDAHKSNPKDFEEYEKCMEDNPCILDDDFTSDWICNLEVDEWIQFAEDYAKKKA